MSLTRIKILNGQSELKGAKCNCQSDVTHIVVGANCTNHERIKEYIKNNNVLDDGVDPLSLCVTVNWLTESLTASTVLPVEKYKLMPQTVNKDTLTLTDKTNDRITVTNKTDDKITVTNNTENISSVSNKADDRMKVSNEADDRMTFPSEIEIDEESFDSLDDETQILGGRDLSKGQTRILNNKKRFVCQMDPQENLNPELYQIFKTAILGKEGNSSEN
eukprot:GHVL01006435.1.p1 GENE.GHVL01006435.1~~GHVL01006435.1.p1  ORF type:complete len:241 (-),score=76.95 GHVL01006435.1:679-1335(-)